MLIQLIYNSITNCRTKERCPKMYKENKMYKNNVFFSNIHQSYSGLTGITYTHVCVCMLLLLSHFSQCPTLCDPIDGSPPGSPVPGILQARTLEWVAISFSNAGKWKVKVKSLRSCPTLSHPMDCSPPGSSIHGIFQAGVLEWGAIAFSRVCIESHNFY